MFFHVFLRKKMIKIEKNEGKKISSCPTPPEDEAICLFAGLPSNPDMPLSHVQFSNLEPLCAVKPDLYRSTHQTKPKNGTLCPHRAIEDIHGTVEMSEVDAACCDCVSEMGFRC
jgi:hypothetical protein